MILYFIWVHKEALKLVISMYMDIRHGDWDSVYLEQVKKPHEVLLITPLNPVLTQIVLDFNSEFADIPIPIDKYVTFSRLNITTLD